MRTLSICLLKKHHQNKAGVQLCSPSSHLHLHILCEVGSWRHFIRPRPVYIDSDPAGCCCCCPALQASSGALSHPPKPSASQGAWPACGSGAQQLSLTATRWSDASYSRLLWQPADRWFQFTSPSLKKHRFVFVCVQWWWSTKIPLHVWNIISIISKKSVVLGRENARWLLLALEFDNHYTWTYVL